MYENSISSLYEACKPEILQGQFRPLVSVVQYLRGVVENQIVIRHAIEDVLNLDLPDSYEKDLFQLKSQKLYDLALEYASRGLKWAA
ncbi:MAG: hypothetical protein M3Y08_10375 [Fibrobacterota bacterium]|nr:hypothetical protein [Fibrobacterota bacterium]